MPHQRPRILYLTKTYPYFPAVSGDAVYSRGVIRAWSQVADLTVLCTDSGGQRDADEATVQWRILGPERGGRAASIASRYPLIAWRYATREYKRALTQALDEPGWDAIVMDNIGLAFALRKAKAYKRRHRGTRLVYVSHELEFRTRAQKYESYRLSLFARLAAAIDLRKVRRSENSLILGCDNVTVINPPDALSFAAIDASEYKYVDLLPGYDGPVALDRTITEAVPRRVLILGGRRSEQKQQILTDWLELSYEALVRAGIETLVVGDIGIALRDRIATDFPLVGTLGFAEDLEAVIGGARAGLIVDTVGSGFKLRLLTHVFQRLPILGLSEAIEGLPTMAGSGYLAADSLSELVELVCGAIDNTARLDAIQRQAFADCEQAFSWTERTQALKVLASNAATGRGD